MILRWTSLAFLVRVLYAYFFHWLATDSYEYLKGFDPSRPPLYPLFVYVCGDYVLIVQCLLGAATVGFVYKIGGKIPALLLTFAPLTIHYTATVMSETLFTFLVVLTVYFENGVLLGLSSLVRSVTQPFAILVAFVRPKVGIIALLITLPWMLFIYSQTGKFAIQTGGYAINLYYGAQDVQLYGSDPWQTIQLPENPLQDALSKIVNDPLGWVMVRIKQYPRLFIDSGDYLLRSYNQPFGTPTFSTAFKIAIVFGQIVFFALAIYGAFYTPVKYVAFPLFMVLIHIPMWIETRYFLPAIPFCCLMAANALKHLVTRTRVSGA